MAVGLARQEGDLATLGSAWRRARTALVRHPINLYALQPLGELAAAAARLREREWATPHLKEAQRLLGRAGHPGAVGDTVVLGTSCTPPSSPSSRRKHTQRGITEI
ncbi:MAG: hypothetical protein M3R63_11755 [Actinomycetota bacterium]|nr:hypothetical protein [Actinomycetota bacterium]